MAQAFTKAEIADIERLAGIGLTQDQIADWFGYTDGRLRQKFIKDATAYSAYKKGRAEAVGKVAKTLFQKAMEGDKTCMIFYLKTQGGWRETERVEHTGADGGAIKTEGDGGPAAVEYIRSELARLAATGAAKPAARKRRSQST